MMKIIKYIWTIIPVHSGSTWLSNYMRAAGTEN
jgi:hypothetical protein